MSTPSSMAQGRTLGDSEVVETLPGDDLGFRETEQLGNALIGRYLVIEKLGAGAMGVVYAAYDPKLDRKVALKLLESKTVEEARVRLEREAQALAKLAHPNVVAVYDVDTHRERLFVAMELIAGKTLRKWRAELEAQAEPQSRGGRSAWRRILAVFMDAGRGLAAAHEAGLIHRDFKPDNVMVGDDGRARVMDFGLARPQLEGRGVDPSQWEGVDTLLATPVTHTGALMGTPAYMAPEQFAGKADARSDQFGFCVALYEALYGQRPFTNESLEALMKALAAGELLPEPQGRSVPAWLRAVVLRGLAADPEQRWPSMEALLEALAADPSRRRQRWGAALLGGALVCGAFGGALWAVQAEARTCANMQSRLAGVWDAEREAAVQAAIEGSELGYAADSWRAVEAGLDAYARAWVQARTETCEAHREGDLSAELMDLRVACLDDRLHQLRATVEVLADADEAVISKAIEGVAALPGLERCLDAKALRAALPPPEDPELAARVEALDGQLLEARTLEQLSKYARARELVDAVLADEQARRYEPLRARAQLVAASLDERTGDYERAQSTLAQAYASALGLGMRAESAEAASLMVWIEGFRMARPEQGKLWAAQAEPLARAAGTAAARLAYVNNTGNMLEQAGEFAEARALYEGALAQLEPWLGADHPRLVVLLSNLGGVTSLDGDYALGRERLERALALSEQVFGPLHPNVSDVFSRLARNELDVGDDARAQAYLERGLAIDEAALGPEHPAVAINLTNLSTLALRRGQVEQAREMQLRALEIMKAGFGPEHPNVAACLVNLGELAEGQGELAEARSYHERALAVVEQAFGPDHPSVGTVLGRLAQLVMAQGDRQEAVRLARRARGIAERALGPRHLKVGNAAQILGSILRRAGEHADAREQLEWALEIYAQQELEPGHDELVSGLVELGWVLVELGELERALAVLERALEQAVEEPEPELRLLLARALWQVPEGRGRDRERARALAREVSAKLAGATEPPGPELDALARETCELLGLELELDGRESP